jgi:hypothetical protein
LGKKGGLGWIGFYCGTLLIALVFAAVRWIPVLEFSPPFSWLTAGRREFALMLGCGPGMLAVLIPKLKKRSIRIAVTTFLGVVITYFMLPFVLPIVLRQAHQQLNTEINGDGICMQTTAYTCGPASAVTALRQLNLDAKEGDIAISANTNPFSGTQPESLCRTLNEQFAGKIHCSYAPYERIEDLPQRPCVVVIKYSFLIDHFVAVLTVNEEEVILGDPIGGKRRLSHADFCKIWRGTAITLQKL